MNKKLLLILFLISSSACTQQHLILAKNLSRAKFITLDQILEESGLKSSIPKINKKKNKISKAKTKKKIFKNKNNKVKHKTITLKIPKQEEFSINLNSLNLFIVLKSLSGDIQYLDQNSNPDKGFFFFKMGKKNSMVSFNIYDLSGIIRKKIDYQIHALKSLSTNNFTNNTLTLDNTKKLLSNNTLLTSDIAQTILTSLRGKGIKEKIRVLKKNTNNPEISEPDKQTLLTELIKLYIEDYSYKKAESNINKLKDLNWKNYLLGLYNYKKKKYNVALQFYIKTLNANPTFKEEFLPSIIALIKDIGNVGQDVINKIEDMNNINSETDKYALNQIGIAQIYELNTEIKKAEKILKDIIKGNYSFSIIRLAESSLKELKDEFLDYQ